jgi:uncharacterized protein (TIGR02246 family)
MERIKTMRNPQTLLLALALAVLSAWAPTKENSDDRKAIESIAASFQDAWNSHDTEALASLMAEEVDFVTVMGVHGWEKGRKEFKDRHTEVHQTLFKESVLAVKETHVKFIRPDVAIAHVVWETKGDKIPDRKPGEPRDGIFTWVLEKRAGKWLIIASQNTESKPPRPSR